MCLFRYKEKRYGKLALTLFALILIAASAGAIYGGVYAVLNMSHWVKYLIVSVAGIVGLGLGTFGFAVLGITFSMINQKRSVRDRNKYKGVSGTYLCDKCGRVISRKANVCEHCGAIQEIGKKDKKCPDCKAKNNATAAFCEKCGYKFKD